MARPSRNSCIYTAYALRNYSQPIGKIIWHCICLLTRSIRVKWCVTTRSVIAVSLLACRRLADGGALLLSSCRCVVVTVKDDDTLQRGAGSTWHWHVTCDVSAASSNCLYLSHRRSTWPPVSTSGHWSVAGQCWTFAAVTARWTTRRQTIRPYISVQFLPFLSATHITIIIILTVGCVVRMWRNNSVRKEIRSA